jgi:hypothetical protein
VYTSLAHRGLVHTSFRVGRGTSVYRLLLRV